MQGFSQKIFLPVFLLSVLLAGVTAAAGDDEVRLNIAPDHIRAGTFYHGTGIHITSLVPSGCRAVIKIEGRRSEVVLNRKGKLAVIWLNVGKVTVENAPQIYLLAASDELAGIGSREEREKLGLGYEALEKSITFSSDKGLTGSEFGDFLKLKEHSGMYNIETRIHMGDAKRGKRELSVDLPMPASIPPGEYKVQLFCFEQGNLIERASAPLSIEKVGLPSLTAMLAYDHAAAYGVIAIVVAMMTGITMGIIFHSRARQSH